MQTENNLAFAKSNDVQFFRDGGEMGKLMREKDWYNTVMGEPIHWPKSLQTMISVLLHSKFPMFIWWGHDLICFYNDAYRPSLGIEGKHPGILGMPAKEAWSEIWDIIKPLIYQVLKGGEATWSEDQLVPIYRNGHIEDVYWTFSYSRINNDDGVPYGVLVTCVETTDKVISQRKLAESNDLLQFATEAAELGTWDYNPQTGNFIANNLLKEWFGLIPAEETSLEIALKSIAEKDLDRVVTAIAEALDYSKRKPYDIEYSIMHLLTAKERVVLVRGKPFFDEKGNAYRFSGTMEDITEKNSLNKLREKNEQRLRNIVEQAPVAMCVLTGAAYTVEVANEKIIQLWGKSRDEVLGKPIFEGLPEAKNQGLEELLDGVYQTGERFSAQEKAVELPRSSGMETVYQNFVYEPFLDEKGNIVGIIAITIDVTEQVIARRRLEEAEERARLAVDAGKLGTFDFDIQRNIIIPSARFFEIFDTLPNASHDELINAIHAEDIPIRQTAMVMAKETGKLFYEVRIVKKSGLIRWVRVEGIVLKNNKGIPYRMVGTALDFTEQKEMEQKREEYIAIASHELKNPMTSLKLGLDILSMRITDNENKFLLEKSRQQVNRLIALTNELLNVSKISAGELRITEGIFNLQESIQDSITTVQAGIEKNRINILGTPDVTLKGDKFRIEQVLVNLLSNASKYSPHGSVIDIVVTQEPTLIKVEVRDKGLGIDPEKIHTVFEKFSRLQADDFIEGHGLGLYISEQIIRKHGGVIAVESEKGKGSTFWFTLPH